MWFTWQLFMLPPRISFADSSGWTWLPSNPNTLELGASQGTSIVSWVLRRKECALSLLNFLAPAWFETCCLTHLPSSGPFFTWSNGRQGHIAVDIRLDRAICNENFISFWDQISCTSLPWYCSDHHLLLLMLSHISSTQLFSFKFLSMWLVHP